MLNRLREVLRQAFDDKRLAYQRTFSLSEEKEPSIDDNTYTFDDKHSITQNSQLSDQQQINTRDALRKTKTKCYFNAVSCF